MLFNVHCARLPAIGIMIITHHIPHEEKFRKTKVNRIPLPRHITSLSLASLFIYLPSFANCTLSALKGGFAALAFAWSNTHAPLV
jgi:hypothetical protein